MNIHKTVVKGVVIEMVSLLYFLTSSKLTQKTCCQMFVLVSVAKKILLAPLSLQR